MWCCFYLDVSSERKISLSLIVKFKLSVLVAAIGVRSRQSQCPSFRHFNRMCIVKVVADDHLS